jgi:hypothetical protein
MLIGVILNKVRIDSMKIEEIPEKSEQIAVKIKTITNKNSRVLGLFNDTPGFRMLTIGFGLLSSFHRLRPTILPWHSGTLSPEDLDAQGHQVPWSSELSCKCC